MKRRCLSFCAILSVLSVGAVAARAVGQTPPAAEVDPATEPPIQNNADVIEGDPPAPEPRGQTCPPGGTGDECTDPIVVGEGVFAGDLSDNTGSTGDDTPCGSNDTIDEWYCYTATCTGTATATTCSPATTFDTVLAVFDACGGTVLWCNVDDPSCTFSSNRSSITFLVVAGTTYQIRVSAWKNLLGNGIFELDISCLPGGGLPSCPPGGTGDDCTDAFVVGEGVFLGDLSDNTASGVSASASPGIFIDEWYCYTASCWGTARASTCGTVTAFDSLIGMSRSCGQANDTTSNTNHCGGLQGAIRFNVEAGKQYWIRVASDDDQFGTGLYELVITCTPNADCCPTTVSTYPYKEEIDSIVPFDLHWFQFFSPTTVDDRDWRRWNGSTPSAGTGPSVDHTLGTAAGFYLYYETSNPVSAGQTAVYRGPCFDLSPLSAPQLSFWYHMFGADMGTLDLEVSEVSADECGTWTNVFSLSGDQGDQWFDAVVDLSPWAGQTIAIRFVGTDSISYTSDMAVDDIQVGDNVPGACCDDQTAGCVDNVLAFDCISRHGRHEPGVMCGSMTPLCGLALGACCLETGGCLDTDLAGCMALPGGSFQGPGVSCATTRCTQPGACCLSDGSCTAATLGGIGCAGTYAGDDTDCTQNRVCPQPGACCFPDGSCTLATGVGGVGCAGGFYNGDDTSCTPNSCPLVCPPTAPQPLPFSEDFEGEVQCSTTSCNATCALNGPWQNDPNNDANWISNTGRTRSNNTGPAGANSGDWYVYAEVTGCCFSVRSLLSPRFDFTNFTNLTAPKLSFAYHMFGSDIDPDGTLEVQVSTDSGCFDWTTELTLAGEQQAAQEDPYLLGLVDLSAYVGLPEVRLRFRYNQASFGFRGDCALDDIHVGPDCDRNGVPDVAQTSVVCQRTMVIGGQGTCPQPFNRSGNGALKVSLVGDPDFDVTQIDRATVELRRCDGIGGVATHNTGPPGPTFEFEDFNHPNGDDVGCGPGQVACSCNPNQAADGIMDLMLAYKTADLVAALELANEPMGALITLEATGQLLDGTPFRAANCIRLVPPGTGGVSLDVGSNASGIWVEMSPPDIALDEGGYAEFTRNHFVGSVITLTAPSSVEARRFTGWVVNGTLVTRDPTLQITLTEGTTATAAYSKARRKPGAGEPPRRR